MTRGTWIIALLLTAGAVVASGIMYQRLPDRVPTHWNIKGQVDSYGSKAVGTMLTPCIMVGMTLLLAAIPWLSPKQFSTDAFRDTYQKVVVLVLGLFAYIHGVILWATANPSRTDSARVLVAGMFLFFALLGNLMGKIRRNFFVGIRVPWTIASERVWNDTHRVGAWVFVIVGVLGVILCLFGFLMTATVLLFLTLPIPIVYSFVHSKRLEARGEI
jgi:uncharacterized membrane protein